MGACDGDVTGVATATSIWTHCHWTLDHDNSGESWDTECGDKFTFENDGPAENHYRYCPACGRRLVEVRPADDDEEDEEEDE